MNLHKAGCFLWEPTLSEHSNKYMQKKFYKTESEFKEACYMCMVPYKTEEDPLVI